MSPYKIELIEAAPKSQLGEGPHWDAKTQSLYYVDIYPGLLHRYDYKKNQVYTATVEGDLKPISFIIPVKGSTDEFVISIGTSVSVISWNGESAKAKLIRKLDERNLPDVRFNDGKVDTSSRFLFTGTMRLEELGGLYGARLGTFYNYSVKGGFTSFRTNIGISNGLAWNEKTSKFYYIDSIDRNIKEYDYNKVTGDIGMIQLSQFGLCIHFRMFLLFIHSKWKNFNRFLGCWWSRLATRWYDHRQWRLPLCGYI